MRSGTSPPNTPRRPRHRHTSVTRYDANRAHASRIIVRATSAAPAGHSRVHVREHAIAPNWADLADGIARAPADTGELSAVPSLAQMQRAARGMHGMSIVQSLPVGFPHTSHPSRIGHTSCDRHEAWHRRGSRACLPVERPVPKQPCYPPAPTPDKAQNSATPALAHQQTGKTHCVQQSAIVTNTKYSAK